MSKFSLPVNSVVRNSQEIIDAFVEVFFKERDYVVGISSVIKYEDGVVTKKPFLDRDLRKMKYEVISPNDEELSEAFEIFRKNGYHIWKQHNQVGMPRYHLLDEKVRYSKNGYLMF